MLWTFAQIFMLCCCSVYGYVLFHISTVVLAVVFVYLVSSRRGYQWCIWMQLNSILPFFFTCSYSFYSILAHELKNRNINLVQYGDVKERVHCGPKQVDFYCVTFFKASFSTFVFYRTTWHVWNGMRASKRWQNSHFLTFRERLNPTF